MVKATGFKRLGALNRMASAVDIGHLIGLGAGLQIVDRSQMEKVLDLPVQCLPVSWPKTQTRFGKITADRNNPLLVLAPAFINQAIELFPRSTPNQHMNITLANQELIDQVPADEPRATGDEIGHEHFSLRFYR